MIEQELIDQYPKLFNNSKSSPIITNHGVQCGQGWFPIIDQFCKDMSAIAQEKQLTDQNWPYFLQIKEKFGLLRIHIDMSGFKDEATKEKAWGFIHNAVEASRTTCERCGEAGTFRHSNWMHTYCDICEGIYVSARKEACEI